jgi:hypothetical protein
MEYLFAPTTRFRDLYRVRERYDEDGDDLWGVDDDSSIDSFTDREMNRLVERELVTGSPEDVFLYRGYTWHDIYSWAHGKIVWVSPDVFFNLTQIDTEFEETDYRLFLNVYVENTYEYSVRVFARSEDNATVASDILLQLLTTSESREVGFGGGVSRHFPVSGFAFSHFLVQSPNLRVLTMDSLVLRTCHCLAIDALTGTDLRIQMSNCAPSELGEHILLECIRQNRGPTQLYHCRIDTRRLADALQGNNSVTTLGLHGQCSDEERLVFVRALAENEGLVTLYFSFARITEDIWIELWQSVAHHPNLEKIVLPTFGSTWSDGPSDAQKTIRTQAMGDALHANNVLLTIELNRVDYDEDTLDSTVYPLLLANKYRPRVCAIAQEEGERRRMLLGLALGSTSNNPSLIWMLLSGNANVGLGPSTSPA